MNYAARYRNSQHFVYGGQMYDISLVSRERLRKFETKFCRFLTKSFFKQLDVKSKGLYKMLFAEFCSRFVYPSTEPTGQLSTVSSEGGEICPKYDYCFKPIFLKIYFVATESRKAKETCKLTML